MAKKFNVTVMPDTVMYTNISKSQEYNSARLVAKMGDNEYMSISYEWEGNKIPDFAMNLMDFMKANNVETSGVWPEFADSDDEKCKGVEIAKTMKKKKDMEDEEDMEDEDEKKKYTKKKKEKSGAGSELVCKNCKKTKDKCDCGMWDPMPRKTKEQKENKTK